MDECKGLSHCNTMWRESHCSSINRHRSSRLLNHRSTLHSASCAVQRWLWVVPSSLEVNPRWFPSTRCQLELCRRISDKNDKSFTPLWKSQLILWLAATTRRLCCTGLSWRDWVHQRLVEIMYRWNNAKGQKTLSPYFATRWPYRHGALSQLWSVERITRDAQSSARSILE